jgi:hypothetical protein
MIRIFAVRQVGRRIERIRFPVSPRHIKSLPFNRLEFGMATTADRPGRCRLFEKLSRSEN